MTAQFFGELVSADGCLRIVDAATQSSYLVVWPPGYTYVQRDGEIRIVDAAGKIVVGVGDWVQLAGGEVNQIEPFSAYVTPPVESSHCEGPFWYTGDEVSRF